MNGNGGRKTNGLLPFPKTRKRMKVIYTIRVKKENINELSKLEAVENDYIVQWKNGKYQRFGAVAFDNLFKTPSEEGKQWR